MSRREGGRLSLRERRRERESRPSASGDSGRSASLAETLDRVLSRGVVAQAEVVISVADIALVYVGLQALVASVEAAMDLKEEADAHV